MFGKSDCCRVEPLLWDYAASRLRPADRQRVRQHLQRCSVCRTRAEAEAHTLDYLAAYREQTVAPAPPAWLQLREALVSTSSHAGSPISSSRFPQWARLSYGSAALLGALGIAALYSFRPLRQEDLVTRQSEFHRRSHSYSDASALSGVQEGIQTTQNMPFLHFPNRPPASSIRKQPSSGDAIAAMNLRGINRAGDSQSRIPAQPASSPQAARTEDLRYLNTDPIEALAAWTTLPSHQTARLKNDIDRTTRRSDDFVQAMPLLASRGLHGIQAAAEASRQEKEIIDARLAYKITLAFKAAPFRDVCQALRERTGIDLKAGPSTADENVTLFCEERPLRDIMRQITHVFGFVWMRTGQEGAFTYELLQDVRSQIAEEEMRNRDRNAALISLADSMEQYRPYLDRTPEQLKEAAAKAKGREAELLSKMMGQEWGAIQSYFTLTAEQRAALFNYQEVALSADPNLAGLPIMADTNHLLLARSGLYIHANPDGNLTMGGALTTHDEDGNPVVFTPGTPAVEWPEAFAGVKLKLNSPESGRLALSGGVNLFVAQTASHASGFYKEPLKTLAEGIRPSASFPDNAKRNRSLRALPELKRMVSLTPRHACPAWTQSTQTAAGQVDSSAVLPQKKKEETQSSPLHVRSADVWEELHRQTGLPIVADAYTQLYSLDNLTRSSLSVFDALCRVGEAMNVRWKKEGDFLQCRSMTFFWDKRKEIPVRLLTRWQKEGLQKDGLSLQSLLEMAQLSDDQLDSEAVAKGVHECWHLPEWSLVGPGTTLRAVQHQSESRDHARLLAKAPVQQLEEALKPEGLRLSKLPIRLKEEWETYLLQQFHWEPAMLADIRFHVDYVPRGHYLWIPKMYDTPFNRDRMEKLPVVSGITREDALAGAKLVYSEAGIGDIQRTSGVLAITYHWQVAGTEGRVPFGTPPITILPNDQSK